MCGDCDGDGGGGVGVDGAGRSGHDAKYMGEGFVVQGRRNARDEPFALSFNECGGDLPCHYKV